MSVEFTELARFLEEETPFDVLGRDEIDALVPKLVQQYHRRGEIVIEAGQIGGHLYIVRAGAVEVCDPEGVLLDTRDVGDCFGYTTISSPEPSRYRMVAVADTLTLLLDRETFDNVARRHPDLREFFGAQKARIRGDLVAARRDAYGGDALRTPVSELLLREAVTAPPSTPIREAAVLMTERRVSALVIAEGDGVVGIVSDRDLRTRVLAADKNPGDTLADIMSTDLATVDGDTRAFDASLLMMQRGVHHLPVLDGGRAIGVISSTDLLRLAQADPVYLAGRIGRAPHAAEVARLVRRLPGLVAELDRRSVEARDVSWVVTATVDAATRRLVTLAEAELGPPPVDYCWVALGSQARRELGVASDQDSALVLASEPRDRSWFVSMGERVTAGLAEAGYALCPGDMMASNPRWQRTVEQWFDLAASWTARPEADAVLDAQVFFDMRPVAGTVSLGDRAREAMLAVATESPRFHAHLARGAVDWQPPLGFFRGLVVERRGEYRNTLDIKAGGISAVVQIARLHALAEGVSEVGTIERIEAAVGTGRMVEYDARNLIAAFEELRRLQLHRHARCITTGVEPDNHLDPSVLSARDRRRLRNAFKAISGLLDALALRYPISRM